jgi:hypothetical protein
MALFCLGVQAQSPTGVRARDPQTGALTGGNVPPKAPAQSACGKTRVQRTVAVSSAGEAIASSSRREMAAVSGEETIDKSSQVCLVEPHLQLLGFVVVAESTPCKTVM